MNENEHIAGKSRRQTNMELCRIVAITMVLVLHADFAAFGAPEGFSAGALGRVVAEMLALVSVDVFVMISGWFGIRASVRGFMKFLFQCLFFLVLPYMAWLAVNGWWRLSWSGVAGCLAMGPSGWFIKAYAGLYLLSPLLNMASERFSERQLRWFLILFFTYQTVWGWLGRNTTVADGYSAFSFIGLYMLARYMRSYGERLNCAAWIGGYLICSVAATALYFVLPAEIPSTSYASPLTVAGALCLFMAFATARIRYNAVINWLAASAFAVYLLHTSPMVMGQYLGAVRRAYAAAGLAGIIAVIAFFFAAAVLLDQVRAFIWRLCTKKSPGTFLQRRRT